MCYYKQLLFLITDNIKLSLEVDNYYFEYNRITNISIKLKW